MRAGAATCGSVGAACTFDLINKRSCRRLVLSSSQFWTFKGRSQWNPRERLFKVHALPANAGPPEPDIPSVSVGLLFSLADAAAATDATTNKPSWIGSFLAPISDSLEVILKFLQSGLDAVHVPYSYGFSIILLTLIVKIATYPFTKRQVESSMAMLTLKPRINNIKKRYGDDKDRIQRETSLLYEEAGVDPSAGCVPTIVTIPILWGLFRTLQNVSNEGFLENEGFFWIPSLAGPTSIAARQEGSGIAWLYPFVDGEPPIGWDMASRYLVLPVLLVALQYVATSVIQPPVDPNDEGSERTQFLVALLPLLIGWFSLNLPSGLSLYYLSNTLITSGQQVWLRKLGGAEVGVKDLGPVTQLGMGRRTGEAVHELPPLPDLMAAGTLVASDGDASGIDGAHAETTESEDGLSASNGALQMADNGATVPTPGAAAAAAGAQIVLRRRCKRRKKVAEKKTIEELTTGT